MLMSKFSKAAVIGVTLALAACASAPEPAPAPVAESPETARAAAEAAAAEAARRRYAKAIATLKAGQAERAIELLREVGESAPDLPFVHTNLGLAYFKLERFELAEQAFAQALAHNSRDAVAHNHLGILERRKGQFEIALERYRSAIAIDRDYARAHLNLGILFDIYLQDLEKALAQYQKYQSLVSEQDEQVAGWILDIERRLKSAGAQS